MISAKSTGSQRGNDEGKGEEKEAFGFTSTVQLLDWLPLETVIVFSPALEYQALKLGLVPELGLLPGADQEYDPVPPDAFKVTVLLVFVS